jgi:hypothetical protein
MGAHRRGLPDARAGAAGGDAMQTALRHAALAAGLLLGAAAPAPGAEWFVGPAGQAANPGTAESPWDIASALGGAHAVAPGDTIRLLPGTYRRRPREQFEVKLAGAEGKPVVVRPAPAARATIDGGLDVLDPSKDLWIRDLEILVSEPTPDRPVPPGSHPEGFDRPWGGLNVHGGTRCKFINLVIHDTRQAVSWWVGSTDSELYGCLLYDNGWLATDRGHGHCVYTQNKDGVKTISNCIMTCTYDGTYTMHAYGSSRAFVDHYLLVENICYGKGPFLVGGGQPSRGIRVFRNLLHGVGMQIGYNAPSNADCEVRDNVIAGGGLAIVKYDRATSEGNLVVKKGDRSPAGAKAVLLPNAYDPARAHLAVFNWTGAPEVEVPAGTFLKPGDAFRLLDPKDVYGKPVFEGRCAAASFRVPVKGEFGAWVVVKP